MYFPKTKTSLIYLVAIYGGFYVVLYLHRSSVAQYCSNIDTNHANETYNMNPIHTLCRRQQATYFVTNINSLAYGSIVSCDDV